MGQRGEDIRIRAARKEDIPTIVEIVNAYAAQDLMLPRSPKEVERTLSSWVVADADGRVVGCGALSLLSPELAEIRSLAVAPDMAGRGIGRAIVEHLVERARALHIKQVAALTLQQGFFERLGFRRVDRWALSPKIWSECVYCPKFHRCDEIAVAMDLVLPEQEETPDYVHAPVMLRMT
ncbi:MAG: N-acetyltransferase [Chloroflexi bacterium]|nr:N-acetyltransferase [Chloroflexota bacterium]